MISRGDEFVVPHGSTVLEADDSVLVVADDVVFPQAEAALTAAVEAP